MTRSNQKKEKRRHLRIARNLPIKLRHDDFDIVTETKNVSCVGAYCQVDRYVAPFTKINATLLLSAEKDKTINCKGVVVRVEKIQNTLEPQYNIAIYFNEISKVNMSRINHFIKENHSSQIS